MNGIKSSARMTKTKDQSASVNVDKKARRRISHSAIEKRRRLKTNSVLNELQCLVPWLNNESKFQKLEVLENACKYIKQLLSEKTFDNASVHPSSNSHQSSEYRRQSLSSFTHSPTLSSCSSINTPSSVNEDTNSVSDAFCISDKLKAHPPNLYPKKSNSRMKLDFLIS
ncbi:hypothetical protein AYI68_g3186 [Smittium mucronatum]|uniref:BHLH domain-containing protein n=1 Tax=Smittium mucronatum TaxID=133383 RepID=A0A1R0H0M1_9FUNG|nr:hypothetical protein AYI68_g3186 [Smittium mucronatum]